MRWWVGVLFLWVNVHAMGQAIVRPRGLQVTYNKTSNLIFPSAIMSVDRGSERIVVQKSTNNILRVKADTVFMDTTNLSVITSDGKLYSFLVSYSASPEVLNLDLGAGEKATSDTAMVAMANAALSARNNLYGLHFSEGRVRLSIVGVYTTSEVLVLKLRVENHSSLSFEQGRLQVHVSGTGTGIRRAIQETEIAPLLVQGAAVVVKEKQSNVFAVVLGKVGLGKDQVLQIDISEKAGERHLALKLRNEYILRAMLIR